MSSFFLLCFVLVPYGIRHLKEEGKEQHKVASIVLAAGVLNPRVLLSCAKSPTSSAMPHYVRFVSCGMHWVKQLLRLCTEGARPPQRLGPAGAV